MDKINKSTLKQKITQVFFKSDLQGSTQIIKVYKTIRSRDLAFASSLIKFDFDYSFVVFTKEGIDVRWKNRNGEIQFCGAGAFAVANYAQKYNDCNNAIIFNKYIKVNVCKKRIFSEISFLGLETIKIEKDLFLGEIDGIYFKQLKSIKSLKMKNIHLEKFILDNKPDPHGFCLFYFNKKSSMGHVRYFCPWYGRTEDSVTISIHKYLTPLVFKLTGKRWQQWNQLSEEGGMLKTYISKKQNEVSVRGTYREI